MERTPLRNNGLITKNEYVGKTHDDAKTYAEEGGFTTRIVEEDGNAFILEYSVNDRRLNFRTRNGVVTDVFCG
jgi:hypothetical protein